MKEAGEHKHGGRYCENYQHTLKVKKSAEERTDFKERSPVEAHQWNHINIFCVLGSVCVF